jgi:TonB family protein
MYFDFEDYRPDITPVGGAISWREGILLSIIGHMALIILLLLMPRLFPYDPTARPRAVVVQQPEENTRFVFMDPKVDLEALRAPARAPNSDKNRVASAPEVAPKPDNPLPFSRGNTPERVERVEPDVARGRGAGPEPLVDQPADPQPAPKPSDNASQQRVPDSQSALLVPPNRSGTANRPASGGALGDALRNLNRYIRPEQFENAQGGLTQFGPFQFDSKGVDFGPWIKRFAAQVKRNWDPLIPNGPMMMRQSGHVVVTLNVHRNGAITDVTVAGPCPIDGYNTAAFGSLVASNPTQPLPADYPTDKVFFTITFFYNERPPE